MLQPNKPRMENSLPEFMNFKLFDKTILVGNIQFGFFLGHSLSQRENGSQNMFTVRTGRLSAAYVLVCLRVAGARREARGCDSCIAISMPNNQRFPHVAFSRV